MFWGIRPLPLDGISTVCIFYLKPFQNERRVVQPSHRCSLSPIVYSFVLGGAPMKQLVSCDGLTRIRLSRIAIFRGTYEG